MSGFSPEWLALREPVDHRSRARELASRLKRHFGPRRRVSVIDLGCGAGSNIRATAPQLPNEQEWTLVDYDPRLLAAARERLRTWAEHSEASGDALHLSLGAKRITVRFKQADLNKELDSVLRGSPDLVTASAFFDLCSAGFIWSFAEAVSARKAAFFTVLTYNGEQGWGPMHAADSTLLEAFKAHQLGDKGFGAAAGWQAPKVLRDAFEAQGYAVEEGDSPWRLGKDDRQLIADLASGFADAAAEMGTIAAATLTEWRKIERQAALVGHTDTLALPIGA